VSFSGGRWSAERFNRAQLSRRIAVLGALALLVFGAIFFRLWYLQILSADKYLAEAQGNRVRETTVQAPRGEILDRNGKVLVTNRTALALQVRAEELPNRPKRRRKVLERVGELIDMPLEKVRKEIRRQTRELPSNPVTLKRDVPPEVVYYVRENQRLYPGVTVDRVYVRKYPRGTLATHVLGYVREVTAEDLEEPRYSKLQPGDRVGKEGVELTYDHILRGVNGVTRVPVDATGAPTGRPATAREPIPGNDLRLTLDLKLQQAGERALASQGKPGAFVAMDVESGEILALGSAPTYDLSVFAKPTVTQAESYAIFGNPKDDPTTAPPAPGVNRAILGGYPTGSVFKPVTALAALDAGAVTPSEVINDGGAITIGNQEFTNAGRTAHGPVDLRKALQVSSDVYFYTLGARLNPDTENGKKEWIQDWANELGLGVETGIDIPGEGTGLIPTPEWRNQLYKEGATDRPWSIGDNVQTAIGQGDVQASPLQLAVAYAAIGNGGKVVRPHVAYRAEDQTGQVVQEIEPAPQREVEIEPEWRDAIMDGLEAAAMEPGGTSYGVFAGFPVEVAGKTGTAERPPYGDQSWYVALAPADEPRIVVAATVEQGGFGADSAAPLVREILATYFDIDAEDLETTTEPAATGTVVYD
jgi:penicillin-binding protein 2